MPAKLSYTGPSLGTLHEEYAKKSRIDEQAPLISAGSITIEAPGPAVWAVISDVAGWPAHCSPPVPPEPAAGRPPTVAHRPENRPRTALNARR